MCFAYAIVYTIHFIYRYVESLYSIFCSMDYKKMSRSTALTEECECYFKKSLISTIAVRILKLILEFITKLLIKWHPVSLLIYTFHISHIDKKAVIIFIYKVLNLVYTRLSLQCIGVSYNARHMHYSRGAIPIYHKHVHMVLQPI